MSSNPQKAGESSSSQSSTESSHSDALAGIMAQLSGAHETQDSQTISEFNSAFIGTLLSEKKIIKKKVEVKEDAKFADSLNTLGLGEEKKSGEEEK